MLNDELIDPDKQVRLELWAYNPKQFSEDNSADDISVVLFFGDTNDERIDEAVDLKSLGIRGTDKQKMTEMLYQCYGLKDNT